MNKSATAYVLTARFDRFERDSIVILLGVFSSEEQALIYRNDNIINGTLDECAERRAATESNFDIREIPIDERVRAYL